MTQGAAESLPLPQEQLEERIGYTFTDFFLLRTALTHSSYVNESDAQGMESNERLEFLGDSVLGLVMTDMLYRTLTEREGAMTRLKGYFVSGNMLAQQARELALGDFLHIGQGDEKRDGRSRSSYLANAFEALLGAVYLDGGLEPAYALIKRIYTPLLDTHTPEEVIRKDHKSMFQGLVQSLALADPSYLVVSEEGPSHDRFFTVELSIGEHVIASGTGKSKKSAEQDAAGSALENIESGTLRLEDI